MNVPVVNQIVWRFDEAVSAAALDEMWRNLDAGPINRTVRRAWIPGARDSWVRASRTSPLVMCERSVSPSELSRWIQQRAAVALDPLEGPVWQLAATALEGGGSAVSLVASHVVGDGGALTSAAISALRGEPEPDDFRSAFAADARGDVLDAVGQWRSALSGVCRVAARTARGAVMRSAARAEPGRTGPSAVSGAGPTDTGVFTPSTVVVDCPTAEWSAAARAAGGSANSLLVALALGVLRASGRVDESESVKVSLPVSTRVAGDIRANATSGASIIIDAGDSPSDLSTIRRKAKNAFTEMSDTSITTDFELTKPLVQLLPDAVVAFASRSATAPLCLCSNLGERGRHVRTIGDAVARSVVMRSMTQNTTVELLRRTKGGVSVWWNTSGETSTLCVTGLDPDCFASAERLRDLLAVEYERWRLTPTFW